MPYAFRYLTFSLQSSSPSAILNPLNLLNRLFLPTIETGHFGLERLGGQAQSIFPHSEIPHCVFFEIPTLQHGKFNYFLMFCHLKDKNELFNGAPCKRWERWSPADKKIEETIITVEMNYPALSCAGQIISKQALGYIPAGQSEHGWDISFIIAVM
ncbi:MAG: hypothetical protein NTX36_06445 [Proteobacteria bacterium]|nr:hypothetical protein [Pseudomonadota bacterium]